MIPVVCVHMTHGNREGRGAMLRFEISLREYLHSFFLGLVTGLGLGQGRGWHPWAALECRVRVLSVWLTLCTVGEQGLTAEPSPESGSMWAAVLNSPVS